MTIHTSLWAASSILLLATSASFAQPSGSAPPGGDAPALTQAELDQLLAPVALYSDSLVSQVLMASTYPLEVVQAERWVRQNSSLKGDALAAALEKEPWDASIKSLVNFPQVLSMMSEKLDWTTKLGDAFLAQQKQVMDTIQKLRGKAKAEGNLESTEQQTVVVKQEGPTQVIVIEPADPEVIYVPTYNPAVVYGTWPYPAYPPYYYYPPGYVAGTAALSFGLGVACGAAWGYAWGGCNWGHGDVDIDVDRNSFRNTNIDRSRYKSEIGSRNRNVQNGRGSWQHDPSHRKGAAYRDGNTANRFGGASTADAARARDAYRGRAESGRQDLARGGGQAPTAGTRDTRDRSGSANRPQNADRSRSAAQERPAQNRDSQSNRSDRTQGSRGGAFDGVGQGSSARNQSQRGQSSRSSPSRSGGGSRGGGARGGGGRGGGRR